MVCRNWTSDGSGCVDSSARRPRCAFAEPETERSSDGEANYEVLVAVAHDDGDGAGSRSSVSVNERSYIISMKTELLKRTKYK